MDDGSYSYKKTALRFGQKSKTKKSKVYYFNTQSFCYEDIKILKKALKFNFNFDTNIYKDRRDKDRTYYLLYIQPQSKDDFINLIKSFLIEIFYYKL